ncbi:cubilin-like, partial [Ruditapes philippinarum]|uniref:cubilin-like n=1 Tax=Ruditapes philippinarum TaxID=129788 RepID=UPI00295A9822
MCFISQSHGCGGILNSTTGSLRSKDSDGYGRYDNNQDCRWIIVAGDNNVIRLTFTRFQLEYHSGCLFDYIKIYHGMTDKDQLNGTYCGSYIPPVFTSTSNILYVHFHTDYSRVYAGFNATYTQLPVGSSIVMDITCSLLTNISPKLKRQ